MRLVDAYALARYRKAWNQASADYRAAGASWYQDAHNTCVHLAEQANIPPDQAIDVVACLSPGVAWLANVRAAIRLLAGETDWSRVKYAGYPASWRKASDIRYGGLTLAEVTTKRAVKVRAFAEQIRTAGHSDQPCVDGRMLAIVSGNDSWDADAQRLVLSGKTYAYASLRSACGRALQALAQETGVPVGHLQAALWLAHAGRNA